MGWDVREMEVALVEVCGLMYVDWVGNSTSDEMR